ncbi:MAG: cytochrome c biogenesis protein CcdA [Anaerolineales bacterium]
MEAKDNAVLATDKIKGRAYLFLHALAFVLGFSLIFVIGWGGATTILGQLFVTYKVWIARIGGLILIIFGLATMDLIHIPWFYMDTRQQFKGKTGTLWSSLAMGVFFAAGWSPCIGATLGAILTLGFSSETVGQAMYLSFAYSIGLGIPFLLLAFAVDQSIPLVRRLRKYMRTFQIVSGLLIIVIGFLMITAQMTVIARWALQYGFYLDLPSSSGIPNLITAVVAGTLSFLSPCVFPLVPAYLGYLSGHVIVASQ